MANALPAVTALLIVAAGAETLRAQEPPVPPELPELIGPPVFFEDIAGDLELDAGVVSGYFNATGNKVKGAEPTSATAPEPSTFVMAALGCAALLAYAWRWRRLPASSVLLRKREYTFR